MTRLFCFGLVVVLASLVPVQAQSKDPPGYFTNSIGMKFVWIHPGRFIMGSPQGEKGRNDLEVQHKVTLTKGFFMSVYPVTQDQWYTIISPGYTPPAEGFDFSNPSRFHNEKKLPVETVSWDDCQVFIQKLQKKEKNKRLYRLPTEAEWEYACRAGTTTPYYFGDTLASYHANYAGAGVDDNGMKAIYRKRTTPVGSFPPNAWGLYDMHGNVAQWCQDRFGPYSLSDLVDPQGAANGGSHVLRGGSWEDGPNRCRSACRSWDSNRGRGNFCFRLCFTLHD